MLRASRPTLIQPHAPQSAPWVQGWLTTDATCRFLARGGFLYIGWFGYQRAWLMSCAGMRQRDWGIAEENEPRGLQIANKTDQSWMGVTVADWPAP